MFLPAHRWFAQEGYGTLPTRLYLNLVSENYMPWKNNHRKFITVFARPLPFPLKAILSSYMTNSFYYLTPTEPFFPQCGNKVLTFPTPIFFLSLSYMPYYFYYLTSTEPFIPQCGNNVPTFPTSIFLLSLFSFLCSFHFFCFLLINFAKKQNSPCRCRWYRSAKWTPPIWSCPRQMAGSRVAGSSSGLGGGGGVMIRIAKKGLNCSAVNCVFLFSLFFSPPAACLPKHSTIPSRLLWPGGGARLLNKLLLSSQIWEQQ